MEKPISIRHEDVTLAATIHYPVKDEQLSAIASYRRRFSVG